MIRIKSVGATLQKNEDYAADYKKSAKEICQTIQLEEWKHRFGHTKMFFKAGIIGDLEDTRDEKIAMILTKARVLLFS